MSISIDKSAPTAILKPRINIAMKIRLETIPRDQEPEIIIRSHKSDDEDMALIQTAILDAVSHNRKLTLFRDSRTYYLAPDDILFFESASGKTYAHTIDQIYDVKSRLYELENTLPSYFVRASKSSIINPERIASISRNIAGPSTVHFQNTHKRISVSRGYYKQLINKLNERS